MKEYLINRNDTFPVPNMHIGMTLRDYFAAKAMQGILYAGLEPVETAKHAYEMADAMMAVRAY